MKMIKIKTNQRIFITGKTQSGKTNFAKYLIRQLKNYIIYDIKREYSSFGIVVHTKKEFLTSLKRGYSQIVIQPNDLSKENFNEICQTIFQKLTNIILIVDEVHKFCTKSSIPYYLNAIVTVGASLGIGFMGISQRCANVHNDILASSEYIISFYQFLDNDINKLKEFLGTEAEKLKNIEYYYFLMFSIFDKKIKFYKPIKKM